MTPEQFSALAQLMQLRNGPAHEAAQLVLVDGLTVTEAARKVGLSPQAASNSVQRCRRGFVLARVAAGHPSATISAA